MLSCMQKHWLLLTALAALPAQTQPGAGFAATPGAKGGQDTFGAYELVKG